MVTIILSPTCCNFVFLLIIVNKVVLAVISASGYSCRIIFQKAPSQYQHIMSIITHANILYVANRSRLKTFVVVKLVSLKKIFIQQIHAQNFAVYAQKFINILCEPYHGLLTTGL